MAKEHREIERLEEKVRDLARRVRAIEDFLGSQANPPVAIVLTPQPAVLQSPKVG